MKNLIYLLFFILLGSVCSVMEASAATGRTIVVSGKIASEDGSAISNISVQVCESKAGFLVMREKVLFSAKVNADGSFKTPPLRHRSSWGLILRVDGRGNGLQLRSLGFDDAVLDRSGRYAAGHVYLDTSLMKKRNLRK